MSNLATRLITLILLLQNRPNQKASELAGKLGISIRTLHRYFGMLDEMGIPVYAERGPYGGFSLVRGYKLPPLVFSLEEAVAVYLGTSLVGEMWGELYRDAAQGAMAACGRSPEAGPATWWNCGARRARIGESRSATRAPQERKQLKGRLTRMRWSFNRGGGIWLVIVTCAAPRARSAWIASRN